MLIKTKKSWELNQNQVTDEWIYHQRRHLLKLGGSAVLASTFFNDWSWAKDFAYKKNETYKSIPMDRNLTSEADATGYNNFYEFSLVKEDVKKEVASWKLKDPWNIEFSGLKEKNRSLSVEDLIKLAGGQEERIYRFRCVEAWSMVIPWIGIPFSEVIKKLEPNSKAKFVKFQTFSDRTGTNMSSLPNYPWPYTEGLTIEEAMHPLTILATGMYGKELPKQSGAPIRLIVPWKYGFKSIKSIQKISFEEKQPSTLWQSLGPDEYGFYANVNPKVDHPRWSQATERVLGEKTNYILPKRIPTLMFNGYETEVASLYKVLDLKKNY